MKPEDFRAVHIKNGAILIFQKKNFDKLLPLISENNEINEVEVTQEMLNNAQVLMSPRIEVPEIPEFNYEK